MKNLSPALLGDILSLLPPELSELPADNRTPLHTRHHNLEAVEVVQTGPLSAHSKLAAPGAALPLAVYLVLLDSLLECLLVRHPGDLDANIGEGKTLEDDLRATHVGRVDERPVLVDHVDDDDELAIVRPIVDESDAPDLDEPAEYHGCRCCWGWRDDERRYGGAYLQNESTGLSSFL